jgi:hypothetical protein
MSDQTDASDTEQFAAEIAAEIDRTRSVIIDGVRSRSMAAQLPQRLGLSGPGMQLLPFLRNLLPDRAVESDALRACERYIPQSTYDAAIAELTSADLIETSGTTVSLSSRGRDIAVEVHGILVDEVNERWGGNPDLAKLERLTQEAVEAAAVTGGLSFSVMSPPYDPPGSSSASRSAERLNCLRIHRGDAHADAWAAAGLTVEEVQDLGPGPERDAIEQDTNSRAKAPYDALSLEDREMLLQALRQLPG